MQQTILTEFKRLDRMHNPLNMPIDSLYDIQDFYIDKTNEFVQRNGLTKFNTTAITGTPITYYVFEAKWNSGTKDIIIRAGTAWYKYDSVNSEFDSLDGSRTSNAQGQAVMFSNELIMVDGATPRKCTSAYALANLSADASMPTDATAVHVHQKRVWLNSTANPMVAYFSKLNSANAADSWSATDDAGNLNLATVLPVGDTIIGYATFAEVYLVIFLKRFIVIYNVGTVATDFHLQEIIPSGAVTIYANPTIGGDIVVPGTEGINTLRILAETEDVNTDDLSYWVNPLYREYLVSLTSSSWKYINGGFSHSLNHYYVFFPLTAGTEAIVFSLDHKAPVGRWVMGKKIYSFCERENGTCLVGSDSGFVYTLNSGATDSGTAIEPAIITPFYFFAGGGNYFAARELETEIEHTATFTFKLDYVYDTQAGDTLTKSVSTNALNRTLLNVSGIFGRGRGVQFKLYHTASNRQITIPRWLVRHIPEGVK